MAKFTDEGVARQTAYRVDLIARYRKAGKNELADKQQAYHDQRVELSKTRGNAAFWIPAYELDQLTMEAEAEELAAEDEELESELEPVGVAGEQD